MWFVVSKKRYRETNDLWQVRENEWNRIFSDQRAKLSNQVAILKSTERNKVLDDVQSALALIQQYQRALSMISTSDPNITKANRLLRKYGLKGDPSATYLGATSSMLKKQWQEEEEKWGDEAYYSGYARIEAEVIDEGEDKEPGYTRARIHFSESDLAEAEDQDPSILTAAKATTEEAYFPGPDTID
jgi:hypothetical protein